MLSYIFDHIIVVVTGTFVALVGLAMLRNWIMSSSAGAFRVIAVPSMQTADGLETFSTSMSIRINRLFHALAWLDGRDHDEGWHGYLVIFAYVFLVLAAVLVTGDATLVDIRVAGLLGSSPFFGELIPLDVILGTLFIASLTTLGIVICDLVGASPVGGVWDRLPETSKRILLRMNVGVAGLIVVSATALYLWSSFTTTQADLPSNIDDLLKVTFWLTLGLGILYAAIVALAGAVPAVPATLAIILMVIRLCVIGLAWTLNRLADLLDLIHDLLVRLVDISELGRGIVNFAAARLPASWEIPRIEFKVRERVNRQAAAEIFVDVPPAHREQQPHDPHSETDVANPESAPKSPSPDPGTTTRQTPPSPTLDRSQAPSVAMTLPEEEFESAFAAFNETSRNGIAPADVR